MYDILIVEEEPLVRIKQLELRGFKSFGPRKVTISLERGLTVFTGPNGSGKSNIFDAIRFVLGDLSARSLRASKMSEVIFDGVAGTPPCKNAYVRLRFDNSDRKIPVDRDVVTLSRRVDRNGFSKYFLDGKSVSRSQLVDILGMAKLYSSGYNMVMQGTITKLAEITPEERRRIIEDFVGIAEYNAKKAEAMTQLRQADTNLRIADARIEDVQYRLERLEEERNDALRHSFLQKEVRRLQAIITSRSISTVEEEKKRLTAALQLKRLAVEELKAERSRLQLERSEVESARRRFDEEIADRGSARLNQIQQKMGELVANIAGLNMEIDSGRISLRGLKKIHRERAQQLESLKKDIKESTRRLSKLKSERDKLKRELNEKISRRNKLSEELGELRQDLGENASKIEKLELELGGLERQRLKLDNQLKTNSLKRHIVSENLRNLEERLETYNLMLKDFEAHLNQLESLKEEERTRFTKISNTLQKSLAKKKNLTLEMEEAEKTAKTAQSAVVEFKAQRSLIEKIATEEFSLQRIEEMGEAGAINGVIGRLEDLLKFDSKYRKALEAAASGWLKALVVKDLETALRCVECLKKMRLGRIKIIPLREVSDVKARDPPEFKGVVGLATDLIRCDEKYRGAVNFVFGDTAVAIGEKAAFIASKRGFRGVDLNGDLYRAGGGIESGYYRSKINVSNLIPSDIAIGGLTKSVQSLEHIISRRKKDIKELENEIMELREELVKRLNLAKIIAREIDLVFDNIERTKENIKSVNKRIKRLSLSLEKWRELQTQLRTRKSSCLKSIRKLNRLRKRLTSAADRLSVSKQEEEYKRLNSEIVELDRRLLKIESDLNFLESNLSTTLKPEYERAKLDLRSLREQIKKIDDKITTAQSTLRETEKRLSELERTKESLSASLASIKEKRLEFEVKLDKINRRLADLDKRYEVLMEEIHGLDLELERRNMEWDSLKNELLRLGYEKAVRVDVKEEEVKASLNLMRFELEQLGSINQLAPTQYDEQQRKYKQLSIKRNQLEKERRAILAFIDEIERKKRNAFTQAYNRISENFSVFFEKLTGGGKAWLSLASPEDPLSGGIDIFAQFPGKAPRLIAGASGGEKSVVTVAFIFAIQNLSPSSFYVFDEIDAHLDPYNAERLADLLKEQAANSQFIVITLRDVVIDRAESLYGVYIQNGVSKIISTRIEEAVASIV